MLTAGSPSPGPHERAPDGPHHPSPGPHGRAPDGPHVGRPLGPSFGRPLGPHVDVGPLVDVGSPQGAGVGKQQPPEEDLPPHSLQAESGGRPPSRPGAHLEGEPEDPGAAEEDPDRDMSWTHGGFAAPGAMRAAPGAKRAAPGAMRRLSSALEGGSSSELGLGPAGGAFRRSRSSGSFGGGPRRDRGPLVATLAPGAHPAVEAASAFYLRLSGHCRRPTTTFLPMMGQRTPVLRTEDASAVYWRYQTRKARLRDIGDEIARTAWGGRQGLAPVELERLLGEARPALEMKARRRLRQSGLMVEKRAKVLTDLGLVVSDGRARSG